MSKLHDLKRLKREKPDEYAVLYDCRMDDIEIRKTHVPTEDEYEEKWFREATE